MENRWELLIGEKQGRIAMAGAEQLGRGLHFLDSRATEGEGEAEEE